MMMAAGWASRDRMTILTRLGDFHRSLANADSNIKLIFQLQYRALKKQCSDPGRLCVAMRRFLVGAVVIDRMTAQPADAATKLMLEAGIYDRN